MDDDFTLWFATFKESRKALQVAANPEAHLCLGVDDVMKPESWLQIEGRAEMLDDPETRHLWWLDMFQAYFSGPDDPNYVVCKVTPSRIEYMTMGTLQPEVWEVN
jgi:general stress protein 26